MNQKYDKKFLDIWVPDKHFFFKFLHFSKLVQLVSRFFRNLKLKSFRWFNTLKNQWTHLIVWSNCTWSLFGVDDNPFSFMRLESHRSLLLHDFLSWKVKKKIECYSRIQFLEFFMIHFIGHCEFLRQFLPRPRWLRFQLWHL